MNSERRQFFIRLAGSVLGTRDAPSKTTVASLPPSTFAPSQTAHFAQAYQTNPIVLNANDWALTLTDLNGSAKTLRLDALQHLPQHSLAFTLECSGNTPGGEWIGDGIWEGVRLWDVLPAPNGATRALFTAADAYQTAIHLDHLHPDSLLAYRLNGDPLPATHGYPLRLLVPGLYGHKMPKWITQISWIDQPFLGTWEARGFSDTAQVQKRAGIHAWQVKNGYLILQGYAFGGLRQIDSVEVRVDGGAWMPTQLAPAPAPHLAARWSFAWQPVLGGRYQIEARADDQPAPFQQVIIEVTP